MPAKTEPIDDTYLPEYAFRRAVFQAIEQLQDGESITLITHQDPRLFLCEIQAKFWYTHRWMSQKKEPATWSIRVQRAEFGTF